MHLVVVGQYLEALMNGKSGHFGELPGFRVRWCPKYASMFCVTATSIRPGAMKPPICEIALCFLCGLFHYSAMQ